MPLSINTETESVREEYFLPSTIETIDGALTEFVGGLNIFCTTNEGWKDVPIIWTSTERSFQIKNKRDIRDSAGVLTKPVITIERTGIAKDLNKKGLLYANIPATNDARGGSIVIARQINQQKTSNFVNADALRVHKQQNFRTRKTGKIVYETITIPMPIYIELSYEVILHAEYQQQINEMITPFLTRPGGINLVNIQKDDHRYEAFIQPDFSHNNNLASLSSEERKYQTKVTIKVLGYIIGDDKNQERPKIVRRQNAVEVKIPRERVIYGDINEFLKDGFYRE